MFILFFIFSCSGIRPSVSAGPPVFQSDSAPFLLRVRPHSSSAPPAGGVAGSSCWRGPRASSSMATVRRLLLSSSSTGILFSVTSISIALRIQRRSSRLLFGLTLFGFVFLLFLAEEACLLWSSPWRSWWRSVGSPILFSFSSERPWRQVAVLCVLSFLNGVLCFCTSMRRGG